MNRLIQNSLTKAAFYIAILMTLFQLYTGGFRLLPALQQRIIHLTFVLVLIFIFFPLGGRIEKEGENKPVLKYGRWWPIDLTFAILAIFVGIYIYSQFIALSFRIGSPTTVDLLVGGILIFLVLEGSRRILGWSLPIISLLFLAYAFWGVHLPTLIRHSGCTIERLLNVISLSTEGILGVAVGVSASYVALFIIFGALLEQSGVGQFFINGALYLFGRMRGGPAKAAVVASTLFGMISGSQVANAASVGVFTIPLMKRFGYSAEFAAGVEAVSSTGGMFMPPVMGATAFLIAEILQAKYADVALAAFIPALLYYWAVFVMVDLRAARLGLHGMPKEDLPDFKPILKSRGHLIIPILVLIFFLFILKASAAKAAFWTVISIPLTCWLKEETRMGLSKILEGLASGARLCLVVAAACASAGIIIGVINITGIGLRISSILINIAGSNLFLLLFLTMIASLILGMGLPPIAAYMVLAVLAAPAIISLGVDPMSAHLFVFYFGIVGAITPPVALAAYTTSGIANSNLVKTCLVALRLGIVAFIIPYIFVYGPALIFKDSVGMIIEAAISATIGVFALALGLEGFWSKPFSLISRVVLIGSAILLIQVGLLTDIIGFSLVAGVCLWEIKFRKSTEIKFLSTALPMKK